MPEVLVVGGSLAGLAAAVRLAKAGHDVELWEATDRLGGRLAASSGPAGVPVDVAPAVIGFPAPWRDLFRKSGRTLEAELARTKAALVPAGPARYTFADGSSLDLPSERGEQYRALETAYGSAVAARWRDLLDWLDDVWQAVRPLGLERELTGEDQLSPPVRRLLRPGTTVADLAAEFDHPALGAVLRSSAHRLGSRPEHTPAWAAVGLSVERRFGRWTIEAGENDPDGRTGRTSTLVDALIERLRTRKVTIVLNQRAVALRREGDQVSVRGADGTQRRSRSVIYAADPWRLSELVPWTTLRRTRRHLRALTPATAPQVSHHRTDHRTEHVSESIDLDAAGVPVIRYGRPSTAGPLESVHDFRTARPDPAAGVAWSRFGDWFRRPPIRSELPGLLLAGPHTAAGSGLSQTVLAGALASYAAHDRGQTT